ncbi:putative TPX2 central domain-containing protein [Lupinus albus]|uniref:Putative TPX2 central domain-containing protein n=1 Tax=Lupinus albus TaxID=3870 RepID=A0A6A4P112_LUPAL|nr:putative TPX2 central domain-containing protein [Lupinus albus]
MEEVFEKIEVDGSMCCDEIDFEYEFDAPRFCDFTRPETFLDAFEAQQWFDYATSYPPSPFLLKFNLGNAGAKDSENVMADDEEVSAIDDNNNTVEDTLNGKMKPFSKLTQSMSKTSCFMKPTASHLAKQKNPTEVQSTHSHRRFPSQNSSIDIQLTKRQKLEAGYLSKAARLKHQNLFRHKKLKEVDLADNNVVSKSKVTIPREPNLETASRAQRHRSKENAEPSGDTKSSSKTSKARPLNKKEILVASSQPSHKKKTPRLTEFNVFHLRTSERAMQHTSSSAGGVLNSNSVSNSETRDLKRTNSSDRSMQEKCRVVNKLRGSPDDKRLSRKGERGVFRNIEVFPLEQNDKRILNEPPTELLSKLSLASDVKQTTKSQSKKQPVSKGLKENRPGSLHQEHEKMNMIKEGIQILCRKKQYKCMNEMGSLISKHTSMAELGH